MPALYRPLVSRALRKDRRDDLRSRRGDVRLQRVTERCEARRREARRDSRPRRGNLDRVTAEADGDSSPGAGGRRAQAVAVEVRDRAAGDREEGEGWISRPVLGDDHPCRSSVTGARRLRAVRAAASADEGDRVAQRPGGRGIAELPGDAADRAHVDESLIRRDPRLWDVLGGNEGDPAHASGRDDRDRRPEDMAVRVGAHADGVRCSCGRARGPEPEEVAVVSGRDHRHDARPGDVRDRRNEDVRTGIRLGAASREVDDVHPVPHGGLEGGDDLRAVGGAAAAERCGRRDVEHAVVPDVRARGDSLDVVDRGMTTALGLDAEARPTLRDVGLDAGDHARDERAVKRAVAIERRAVRTGAREASRDDHLR